MAQPIGPSARDLRSRIVVQRRISTTNDVGGTSGAWQTIIPARWAKLVPLTARRGDSEMVIAARLQGTSIWDCWARWDSLTSTILVTDRVCDARFGQDADGNWLRVFNIRFVNDMDARRRWLFMQLEQGVAEG